MAMITGTRRSSMRISNGFKLSRQIIFPEVSSPNSLISAPATNVRPAPMNTTARILASFSICATAPAMPADTPELSALTDGLSIVTTATPPTFVNCTDSLINSVSIVPYSRISGEGDACFLGNGAKLFDNRHDQRHTLLAPQLLGFTLGIAGNERTVRAGRRLAGAEDADEVVHLPLELVRLDKTVNAQRSEKVPNSLPHAARRKLLAQRKRRRERSPIRSAQYRAENVHHDAESIPFVPAAFAIGPKRQERAACDNLVRICRSASLMIDAPSISNGFSSPTRHFDFAVGGRASSHVDDNRRFVFSRKRDGDRIRAQYPLRAPQRSDQLRRVGHGHANHVALQCFQDVITSNPIMIAIPDADPPRPHL